MREATTTLLSWLAVTLVFMVTLHLDGLELSDSPLKSISMLAAITGFASLIYFIFVGMPILYLLLKRKAVTKVHFITAGVIASLPMALLSGLAQEVEWMVASVVAGVIGGAVFAALLPNSKHT